MSLFYWDFATIVLMHVSWQNEPNWKDKAQN